MIRKAGRDLADLLRKPRASGDDPAYWATLAEGGG